jgi:hypothetical protein
MDRDGRTNAARAAKAASRSAYGDGRCAGSAVFRWFTASMPVSACFGRPLDAGGRFGPWDRYRPRHRQETEGFAQQLDVVLEQHSAVTTVVMLHMCGIGPVVGFVGQLEPRRGKRNQAAQCQTGQRSKRTAAAHWEEHHQAGGPCQPFGTAELPPILDHRGIALLGTSGMVELEEVALVDSLSISAKAVGAMEPGEYIISWRAAPHDDHGSRGRVKFTVEGSRDPR